MNSKKSAARLTQLQQEREEQALAYKHELDRLRAASSQVNTVGEISSSFTVSAPSVQSYEELLKQSNIGLVSADDYKKKKLIVAALEDTHAAEQQRKKQGAADGKSGKLKQKKKATLSFGDDDEEEEKEVDEVKEERQPDAPPTVAASSNDEKTVVAAEATGADEEDANNANKRRKLSKNPDVDTTFLPDRERLEQEQRMKRQLEQQWEQEQLQTKNEVITVEFSYWTGAGHRGVVQCRKGDTIGQFLEKVRLSKMQQHRELQSINAETGMIYVKEDTVIPTHFTFYDLIVTKAQGRTGVLYQFGNVEDIRMINDASKAKIESHAGKVMTDTFYQRHRHIFPYNRYLTYDPSKQSKQTNR